MAKKSAGLVVYKIENNTLYILLAHPGGPYYTNKDAGWWTIPKGEFEDEDPLEAAKREFKEETGIDIHGDFVELKSCKQKSGKMIYAWAVESSIDLAEIRSNLFSIEWPPKSGKLCAFPEIDRAEWLNIETARVKILQGQLPLIEELLAKTQV